MQYNIEWKRNFYSHLRIVHNMEPALERNTTLIRNIKLDPNDPDLYCRACEKKYRNKRNFVHHLRALHKILVLPTEAAIVKREMFVDIEDDLPFRAVVIIKCKKSKAAYNRQSQRSDNNTTTSNAQSNLSNQFQMAIYDPAKASQKENAFPKHRSIKSIKAEMSEIVTVKI
jgi:hypothetical protein